MATKAYEGYLKKIGFSEKESLVYLASLELGAAPVQKIAQKAGVKRATTYVMIESLIDRGLMSTFNKGKKTFFSAQTPEKIMTLLEAEKSDVEEKQEILNGILPDLLAFVRATGEKPLISFFEGVDGLRAIHQEVLNSVGDSLENIVSLDDARKIDPPHDDVAFFRNKLEKKGVKIKILYTAKDHALDLPKHLDAKWESRKISAEKFPLHGEITIFGNKVAAFSYRGKIFGTIIESKEISQTVKVLFELAWSAAKQK